MTNYTIKKAMRDNERSALAFVKSMGVYRPSGLPSKKSWRNALDRLEAKKKIKWSKKKGGYIVA